MRPEEEILRNLKPLSEGELDEVINRLSDPAIKVVTRVVSELTRLARAFPNETSPTIYKAFLAPENQTIRRYLADILRASLRVEWFQPLLELLWNPDKDLRDYAFNILHRFGGIPQIKLANSFLDQLLDYLQDPDETIRERIGQIIAAYFIRTGYMLEEGWEPLSAAQVARVIELAEKVERPVRRSLLAILDCTVEAYKPARPLLIKSLNDIDSEVVIAAMRSLLEMGSDSAYQAVGTILELLDHPNYRVRRQAALQLGRLGRVEPKIIEALLEATFDKDRGVKSSAIGSLGDLMREAEEKDPDVIERLIDMTFDKDERVRESAASQLGRLDSRDTLIISRLAALLRDRDITVRGTAIDGLARIGNKSHIPLLKKFINSEVPIYDIYDSNLVTKAKNAYEQVWDREA